jgi:LPXTG-motif cell wall-anchored protein
VLFANIEFKGVGDYLPVDAGTYDLEARLAGTDTVALSVPGVALEEGTVYTVWAMGLAGGGEPALAAVPSVDASYPPTMPETMPETGGEVSSLWLLIVLGGGLALVVGGLLLRRRSADIAVR